MSAVSVCIPAYRAARTLGTTLEHLAQQTYSDYELVVVESGPDPFGEQEIRRRIPAAVYCSFRNRLLPQQALNVALERAQGERLAFTDADAYPASDWLERLLRAQSELGPVVYGAVACHGSRWLDQGAHLCKFDKWLPGGSVRTVSEGPTINMGIRRTVFENIGHFGEYTIHADTEFSWRLRRAGYTLWFEPRAVVSHHHLYSMGSLLRERFERGRAFARFEDRWLRRGRGRGLLRAAVSVLPSRLVNQLLRVRRNAARAGMGASFWGSLPMVAAVLYAWLVGEAVELARDAVTNPPS